MERPSSAAHATVVTRSLRCERLEQRSLLSISPVGAEQLVNVGNTVGVQQFPKVASDSAGNYVVTWTGDTTGAGTDIYAQRFDASGTAIGSAWVVNTFATGTQEAQDIAMNASGAFVIVWESLGQDGSGDGVYAQRYDAAGVAQGSEFRVNVFTNFNQDLPSVAIDSAGNFVVAWQSGTLDDTGDQDGGYAGVYARRFDSAGVALDLNDVQINSTSGDEYFQGVPSVAMDSSGNYAIAWTDISPSPSFFTVDYDVYVRRFNAAGVAQNINGSPNDFAVITSTTNAQFGGQVAMDSAGNFVVVWADTGTASGEAYSNVFGRRFSNTGAILGSAFQINNFTSFDQNLATVAMDGSGNFIATWFSGDSNNAANNQDGSSLGVYARRYTSAGTADGNEFQVNTYTTGSQSQPQLTISATGQAIIVWTSVGQDGSSEGVYSQRYASPNQNPAVVTGGPYSVTEGQSLNLNATGSSDPEGQTLTYAWDLNNDNNFTDATGVSPTLTWAQLAAFGITDGPASVTNARVRVSDPFGGVTTTAFTINVVNAPPTANAGGTYAISEGDSLILSGSGSDPAGVADPLTYSWDVNGDDVFGDATGAAPTLNWAQLVALGINDGIGQSYNVKVRVDDGDGGVTTSLATTLTINNAPPSAGVSGPASLARGASGNYTLTATDVSAPDQTAGFTFTIDWNGDGSDIQVVNGASGLIVAHAFTSVGAKTIKVTATDKDGGVSGLATLGVTVSAVQVTGGDLIWTGSAGADHVQFEQLAPQTIRVTTTLDNGVAMSFVETFNGITGVVNGTGLAGDDTLDASLLTTTSATLNGGTGNNTLYGGAANDILIGGANVGPQTNGPEGQQGNNIVVGGAGDDTIYGNAINGGEGKGGSNLLLGGAGNDTIYGNWTNGGEGGGNNIIIGGADADTLYDYKIADGAEGGSSLLIAGDTTLTVADLTQVMAEWSSTHPYLDRVANILGPGAPNRLNGTTYLQAGGGGNVTNDGAANQLWGSGGGLNWFWYAVANDTVNRAKAGETHTLY